MQTRWVVAADTGRAHLDLGERSSESLKLHGQHTIVAACGVRIEADPHVAAGEYRPRCANCVSALARLS
jgi:hypothetical protein